MTAIGQKKRQKASSESVLLFVAVIFLVIMGISPFLRLPALRREHQRDSLQQELDRLVDQLHWGFLSRSEQSVAHVAGWPVLVTLLADPVRINAHDGETRRLLMAMQRGLGAEQLYLMDDRGCVLLDSVEGEESVQGRNYAFRPYYREAMMGRSMVYPALGLTSGHRGLFVSAPVRGRVEDDVAGVLVAKLSVEPLEAMLRSRDPLLLLTSPDGVVLAGNRTNWLYRTVAPLTREKQFRIEAAQQFGGVTITSGPADLSGETAILDGDVCHVTRAGNLMNGWRLVSCTPVDRHFRLPPELWLLIAVVGASTLILLLEVVLLAVNVTKRRRIEERHAIVINNCNEALLIIEGERIRFLNPKLCLLTGYGRDELLAMNAFDLFHPGDRPEALATYRKRVAGGDVPRQYEARLLTQNDETRWVLVSAVRILWDGRDAVLAFLIDITQRNRLIKRLYHTERMEAIGQLAGGVAHDFNNLLVGILGHTGVMKEELEGEPRHVHRLETIEQAAHRAAELTQQLLGFARRGRHRSLPIDMHQLILETVHFLSRTVGRTVRFEPTLRAGRHVVLGEPSQLKQVLVNLTINARDAMPDGGEVYIETRDTQLAGPIEGEGCQELPALEISVRDTGQGIRPEDLGRVFEPFFTTKESGKGTGMGLAMIYGIVMNHGGSIRVESPPGQGARFVIVIPVTDRAPVNLQTPAPAGSVGGETNGMSVLAIDDDPVVLEAGMLVLERLGYAVMGYSSVEDAVLFYKEHWQEVDLAIIDMEMPGMDGGACFRQLKAVNPDVRAILTTGYGLDGKAQGLLDEGMAGFLQKPYTFDEISSTISAALGVDAMDPASG